MKKRLFLLGVLVVTLDSSAQESRAEFDRIADANQRVIDGILDKDVWREAPVTSDFHPTRPSDHRMPSEKTEVQIARSDEFIYVAFKAYDSDIDKLSAKGFIQGQNFFSDERLAIYIDSFNNRRNSYFFQVNGNGMRRDALIGNDYFIDDWSTIWYAGTKQYDWGWSAEMEIPIKSIAFDPNVEAWGINFGRAHPRAVLQS